MVKPTRIRSVCVVALNSVYEFIVSCLVPLAPSTPSKWKSVPRPLKAASSVPGAGYASSMGYADDSEPMSFCLMLCRMIF